VVLAIFGEQGTGKATAVKVLVLLLDPSPVPVRKPPRDADSWVTAAAGSWVVGLDNLSDVPPWLSDSLCRASTGDGDVRRKLYSDSDYAVFAFRRCIIFDAIDVGALAPDLADRTVAITLDLIPDEDRADEETFWSRWQDAHPRLLGAVLTLAARVIARLPDVRLPRKPRMADFARILAAVDAELGTSRSTGTPARPPPSPPRACPATPSPPGSRPPSWTASRAPRPGSLSTSGQVTPTGRRRRTGQPAPGRSPADCAASPRRSARSAGR
jgi:hypothetical protein